MDNTSRLLKYLNATRGASSEEDYSDLYAVLEPTSSAEEMGEVYENVLGYNPVTYFDVTFISDAIMKGCEALPEKYAAKLIDKKDEIISLTMEGFTDDKRTLLTTTLLDIVDEYLPNDEMALFVKALGEECYTFSEDDNDDYLDDEYSDSENDLPEYLREEMETDDDDFYEEEED